MFLRKAEVDGEVRLLGAQIGGDLASVGAKLRNAGGAALNADGARITGAFHWRDKASAKGAINLTAAEIGHIIDDPKCWPEHGDLLLNRCRYGSFTGLGITAADRIDWLALQDESRFGQEFWPQPYEQCARVLREMSHSDDAREILIEKERRLRAARRKRIFRTRPIFWVWDLMLGRTVGYGQTPLRAFSWLFLLWALGITFYQPFWDQGAFKPNNAFILRADEWVDCAGNAPSQLACYQESAKGRSLPAFNRWIYSLDVLFPLVQLEQQVHWIPDEDREWGWYAKGLVYTQIVMGWLLSLLAVAGLSGIIKSD